ncbi:hypothetical protein ALC56_10599 [Trachymyrmex septentrionalis]|uniref:Uncharacterized protein n=1 Tax=Trachymyrmex septentrionalis TaxID=34720 RepID=A0A151JTQ0_9HYME|nr:hypothetical protein ALC56_10599 [Trachymyrmex septentrionalis]
MGGVIHANKVVSLCVKLRFNNFCEKMDCIVLLKITQHLPQHFIPMQSVSIPKYIKLADPNFNIPTSIDILIGAESFWRLICAGQIKQSIISSVTLSDIIRSDSSLNFHLTSLNELRTHHSTLYDEYKKFMDKYIQLNYMKKVNSHTMLSPNSPVFYLLHYAVRIEASSTTKFQVILDGSCKTTTGYNFQITQTYGISSASFLAIRILRKLMEDNANCYLRASQIVLRDFYVDDLVSSNALSLQNQNSFIEQREFILSSDKNFEKRTLAIGTYILRLVTNTEQHTNLEHGFSDASEYEARIYLRSTSKDSRGARYTYIQPSQEVSFSRDTRIMQSISLNEQQQATFRLIKAIQSKHFSKEIKSLSNHEAVSTNSPILKLNLFFDNSGILRMGDCLRESSLLYSAIMGNLPEPRVKTSLKVFDQIEAILNSHLLTPISSDPNNFTSLTPRHFLVDTPLTSYPEPFLDNGSYKRPITRLCLFPIEN